ncbi:MAG: 16S rRNA (adenine(1518)-N(6)/adenine(1519)-N(6))-dimethyltransferase RsmA [Treponema sp.]|nr:16S rRNA (adenine(1518)-N(6)/adenine(1519)-N(6))-dimethyltransferase RsmA [Treponema sp.]
MQKKFGQNFLIIPDARKKLIDSLDINENTRVWEIGPGLGAMTHEILERGADLTVFEIDRGFISLISDFFKEYQDKNKFRIIEGDVLKNWKKEIEKQGKPDRLFGNLPYNIAATIIADTIENNIRFDKCVFTVQKEVAQRMCAKPGSADYSSFSVLCNWAYDIKALLDLNGNNFWPKPNVDSRAVIMTPKENFPACKNPELFCKLQRALFSSRRKNVRNNLTGFIKNNDKALEYLEKAQIDPMLRAEVLSIEQILNLSDIMALS